MEEKEQEALTAVKVGAVHSVQDCCRAVARCMAVHVCVFCVHVCVLCPPTLLQDRVMSHAAETSGMMHLVSERILQEHQTAVRKIRDDMEKYVYMCGIVEGHCCVGTPAMEGI